MKLRVYPDALEDVLDITRQYARQRAALGQRFFNAVRRQYRSIQANPKLFPLYPTSQPAHEIRFCIVNGFPYLIIYLVRPSQIDVVAVVHERRQPAHWRDRLKGI